MGQPHPPRGATLAGVDSRRPPGSVGSDDHCSYPRGRSLDRVRKDRPARQAAPPLVVRPATTVPFVGRDRELSTLLPALRDGAGFVVTGPAGIGRTRLLREVAARSRTAHAGAGLPVSLRRVVLLPAGASAADDLAGHVRDLCAARPHDLPMLLVVDDAHLMTSEPVLRGLTLARESGATLLLAVDSDHDSAQVVLDLGAHLELRRLDLAALDDAAAAEFAASLADLDPDSPGTQRLTRLAEGNPLALVEVLHAAVNQGALVRDDGGWGLRGPVRLPQRRRGPAAALDGLTESAQRGLELVALAEPIPMSLIESLVRPEDLLELERLSLVLVRDPEGRRDLGDPADLEMSVIRPLIREVVLQRLPTLRRRALLRDLLGGYPAPEPYTAMWLRVIGWRLATGVPVEEAHLLDAAYFAQHRRDVTVATALADAAWRSSHSVAAAVTLATVLFGSARHERAHHVLDDAEARHGRHEAVLVCRARGFVSQDRLDDAVAAVSTLDTSGGVLCRAIVAFHRNRIAESYRLCGRLVADPDPVRRAVAAVYAAAALRRMGRSRAAMRAVHAIRAALPGDGDRYDVACAVGGALDILTAEVTADSGDLVAAHELLADERASAESAHRQAVRASMLVDLGRSVDALRLFDAIVHRTGVWETTRRAARTGRAVLDSIVPRELAPACPADGVHDRAEDGAPLTVLGAVAHAFRVHRSSSDVETAATLAATLAAAAQRAAGNGAYADVAFVVHQMGRLGVAYAAKPWWGVPVEGALPQARLDFTRAVATGDVYLLTRVSRSFEAMQANLYAAESYYELARLHRRLDGPRPAAAAARRAHQLAALCQPADTPALQRSDDLQPLSRREREVALLAKAALSDRAIADRLSLSIRTVQNHLYRAYRKLGVNGRQGL